jgi:hypothetical protein
VLELEKSLIQETLAQYDIDTSTIVMGSQTYYKALHKKITKPAMLKTLPPQTMFYKGFIKKA